MIHLDSSVALAQLFAEDRRPPSTLWAQPLVASRLLEYEVWTRLNARGLSDSLGDWVRQLVDGMALVELVPPILERALNPFPLPVRTLDALHLATMHHLRATGQRIELASYDRRMNQVAEAMEFPLVSGL
ncbi:MAG: PIN domain-containing protein [Gammaproteobacteria bacterium]|nr:PIN domain-containing protein [Gammaproteobacteria bacterium]